MFSGAVRAVFRKKKGFGFVKILHWLLLVLFSAAAALARLRLLAVGFDADGLPVPMDLNTMVLPAVLIVAAVIAVIMAQRYPAQRELCGSMELYFAFDRSTLAVLLMVLGSFALIGSAVCSLVFSFFWQSARHACCTLRPRCAARRSSQALRCSCLCARWCLR